MPLPWVDQLVAWDVGIFEGFHNGIGSCGLCPVDSVGNYKWRHEAPSGIFTHIVCRTSFLKSSLTLATSGFVLARSSRKGRSDENVVAVSFYRRQVARLDITRHRHNAFRLKAHFLEGLGKEDGICDI